MGDLEATDHAKEVREIAHHLHGKERWYGLHTSISAGVNEGESESILPFVSTIGTSETWGDWIPLLGSGDTPASLGRVKFDMHRIAISDVINAGSDPDKHPHWIQIAWGATGAAGYAADDFSTMVTIPQKNGKASPLDILMPRRVSGTLVWLRHRVVNRDTQAAIDECTMEFYIGLHEYTEL